MHGVDKIWDSEAEHWCCTNLHFVGSSPLVCKEVSKPVPLSFSLTGQPNNFCKLRHVGNSNGKLFSAFGQK